MPTRTLHRAGEPQDASEGTRPTRAHHWESAGRIAAVVAAGYALHVALRLALAVGRYGPVVFADETGYLVNARLVAGGTAGQMDGSMFYRGGYPLLVAPAYLLTGDPHRSYLLILGLNALMSSAVFPLLYYLLTRSCRVGRGPALAAGFLAAFYPPLVLNALLAQSETALYVLTLLGCVALSRFVAARRRGHVWAWGVASALVAGYLYTTHGRTAPLVAVIVAGLVAAGLARRDLRLPAAVSAAVAGASLAAGQVLNTYLVRQNWGGPGGGDVALVLGHLTEPAVAKNLGVLTLGQYWYLTAVTFGVFTLGLCQAVAVVRHQVGTGPGVSGGGGVRAAARARFASASGGGPVAAGYALLSLAGLVVLTGVFLYPVNRPDLVVYGRYAEVVLPVFLALGLYRLWTLRPVWRAVAELAVGCALVLVAFAGFSSYRDRIVFGRISNSYTSLGLPWMSGSITELHPRRVMAVMLVGAAVLVLFSRVWRLVGGFALAGALVLSSYHTRSTLFTHTQDAVYGRAHGNDVSVPGLDVAQDVGYDVAYLTVEGRWAFQWKLGHAHFVLFDSSRGERAPEVRYVISGKTWPQAAELGARQVWSEQVGRQAVWLVPSRPPAPPTTSSGHR